MHFVLLESIHFENMQECVCGFGFQGFLYLSCASVGVSKVKIMLDLWHV